MERTNEQIAMRVSRNVIITNSCLAVFKLLAGIIGQSAAMVSDAVHTLSDVLSTFIVMIGVKMAHKEADTDHPYGHERFECVAAILLAVILFFTGLGIGMGGVRKIIDGDYHNIAVPGLLALIAAIVSILTQETLYWYTRANAKKIQSGAMMANAWHHRSDALSSVGSLIGIAGARLGFPILDSIACVVICVLILKVAISIFMDAINKMTDKSCDDETVKQIQQIILEQESVEKIDLLQTRLFGNKIYVDVEIEVDRNVPLSESHAIAHTVHDAIEHGVNNVKHCMVHVNPTPLAGGALEEGIS